METSQPVEKNDQSFLLIFDFPCFFVQTEIDMDSEYKQEEEEKADKILSLCSESIDRVLQNITQMLEVHTQTSHFGSTLKLVQAPQQQPSNTLPQKGDLVVLVEYRQVQDVSVDQKDYILNSVRGPSNQLIVETHFPQQSLPFSCPTSFAWICQVTQDKLVEKWVHCSQPLICIQLSHHSNDSQPSQELEKWVVRKIALSELKTANPQESHMISTSYLGYTWVDVVQKGSTLHETPHFVKIVHHQLFSLIEGGVCFSLHTKSLVNRNL